MKKELAEKEHQLSAKPTEKAADSELSWLNVLSQETGENVQERINLQKALFELEETNKRNRIELQHLDDAIARHQVCNLADQSSRNRGHLLQETKCVITYVSTEHVYLLTGGVHDVNTTVDEAT